MSNQVPKFICYKCGYKHFKEGYICPKCSTNNALPVIGSINILLIFFAVACLLLSVFVKCYLNISTILFIISAILAPISLIECLARNDNNGGFKTPDTPNEIIENKVRIPDLMTFKYEGGLAFDYEIKKLIFDVAPDFLNIYKEGMDIITSIDYTDIHNLQILNGVEFKNSTGKSIVTGTIGAIALGGIGAILGAALGSFKTKDIFYLQIDIRYSDNEDGALLLSGPKSRLENLYRKIYTKINR